MAATTIKITLSATPEVASMAKELAKEKNTTVSALFANFIRAVHLANHPVVKPKIAPITESLSGLVKLPENFDYKEFIANNLLQDYGITEEELQQMRERLKNNAADRRPIAEQPVATLAK